MNPAIQHTAKKYVFDILQEKYEKNESIIERLSHYLATEKDVREFINLFVDSYEKGYLKAVDDYRDKLREMGYDVHIKAAK